jgi:hypothetical protein
MTSIPTSDISSGNTAPAPLLAAGARSASAPDMRRIIHHGSKLVIHNRGKQLGRRGLLASGASGTGKSTSITQLGKTFHAI